MSTTLLAGLTLWKRYYVMRLECRLVHLEHSMENLLGLSGGHLADSIMAMTRPFRKVLVSRRLETVDGEARTSLMVLPDDIIFVILAFLRQLDREHGPVTDERRLPKHPRNLLNLSVANRRLRELAAALLMERTYISATTWPRAALALRTMGKSLAARANTKRLELVVDTTRYPGPRPSKVMLRNFTTVLFTLHRLKHLELVLPSFHADKFCDAFANSGSTELPSVQSLVLSPYLDWLVARCPNVKVISTNGWQWRISYKTSHKSDEHSLGLIRSAGTSAPKLQHFEMLEDWNADLVRAVVEHLSHIPSIALVGLMLDGHENLLANLQRLENLRSLTLAGYGTFDVEFEPRLEFPRVCHRIAHLHPEDEINDIVWDNWYTGCWRLAREVFGRCGNLKELWIGRNVKATVVREEDGRMQTMQLKWDRRPLIAKLYSFPDCQPDVVCNLRYD